MYPSALNLDRARQKQSRELIPVVDVSHLSSSNFSDGMWHLSSVDKGLWCPLGPPGKTAEFLILWTLQGDLTVVLAAEGFLLRVCLSPRPALWIRRCSLGLPNIHPFLFCLSEAGKVCVAYKLAPGWGFL